MSKFMAGDKIRFTEETADLLSLSFKAFDERILNRGTDTYWTPPPITKIVDSGPPPWVNRQNVYLVVGSFPLGDAKEMVLLQDTFNRFGYPRESLALYYPNALQLLPEDTAAECRWMVHAPDQMELAPPPDEATP